MCSIHDILDLFFAPESRDTGFFCCKKKHIWMVIKGTRNSSFKACENNRWDINGLKGQCHENCFQTETKGC